jgi:hypothetical protein
MFGYLVPVGIVEVHLQNNNIQGVWPSGWLYAQYQRLTYLSIANNKISGDIPSDIWGVLNPKFKTLDLSGNLFSGVIPEGIPKDNMDLDFSQNPYLIGATSPIPSFLKASNQIAIYGTENNYVCNIFESSDMTKTIKVKLDPLYSRFVNASKCSHILL